MSQLADLKNSLLDKLRQSLDNPVAEIAHDKRLDHKKKAAAVNAQITDARTALIDTLSDEIGSIDLQSGLIVLEYCCCLASLDYRHQVWPYEYMAFSRRVGELWERFCSAAWTHPTDRSITTLDPPEFSEITHQIRARVEKKLDNSDEAAEILRDFDSVLELTSDISLAEDQTFYLENSPTVVDFKSGFGSNEKGNTVRLLNVGRAYRLWDPDTELYLLVRQKVNNHYMATLRNSGLWNVRLGNDAYAAIDELTGSRMSTIRKEIIDFENDLSPGLWNDLGEHLSDLRLYLDW